MRTGPPLPQVAVVGILLVGLGWGCQPCASVIRFEMAVRELKLGETVAEVVARFGPPDSSWKDKLACLSCFPCDVRKQKGDVLFYKRGYGWCGVDIGWYLFFDGEGRLVDIEGSST
jgi:hypothetical protein